MVESLVILQQIVNLTDFKENGLPIAFPSHEIRDFPPKKGCAMIKPCRFLSLPQRQTQLRKGQVLHGKPTV